MCWLHTETFPYDSMQEDFSECIKLLHARRPCQGCCLCRRRWASWGRPWDQPSAVWRGSSQWADPEVSIQHSSRVSPWQEGSGTTYMGVVPCWLANRNGHHCSLQGTWCLYEGRVNLHQTHHPGRVGRPWLNSKHAYPYKPGNKASRYVCMHAAFATWPFKTFAT